jgi:hypothetical protein
MGAFYRNVWQVRRAFLFESAQLCGECGFLDASSAQALSFVHKSPRQGTDF